ncbi:MAG TPA: chalcone isomerase family protein [Steroidobacteraceae bacterium]|nr:chalcone isomerase family protein [Steroidobacteraceae bacterium]
MRRSLHTGFLACLAIAATLAVFTARASTLPAPLAEEVSGLRMVGGGQLRWLGFPIYDASLWTEDGRYQGFEAGEPVALSLWYQRGFSREELLGITSTAWRKLDRWNAAQREAWLAELRQVFRDIEPGHNFTTLVIPGRGTRFYDQNELLGEIVDPSFGPAFLAIWLDPGTVVKDLRAQLLGREQASR